MDMVSAVSLILVLSFLLHGGATFLMTPQQVMDWEQSNGILLTQDGYDPNLYSSESIRLAGFDQSLLTYVFHEERLYQCIYKIWGARPNEDLRENETEARTAYQRLLDGLTNKYGETEYSSLTYKSAPLPDVLFDEISVTGLKTSENRSWQRVIVYTQWVIPCEEGSILIDLSLFEVNLQLSTGWSNHYYCPQVMYSFIPTKEMAHYQHFSDDL